MASGNTSNTYLEHLPKEILLDVFHHLDIISIFQLAMINRDFYALYEQRQSSILLPVLVRDFAPFDEFLQVYTAKAEDISVQNGFYKPRRVVFKRYLGDHGLVLAPDPHLVSALNVSSSPGRGFVEVGKHGRASAVDNAAAGTVVIGERDIKAILNKLVVVRQWQERFPQMRWIHEPQDCRLLRPHEEVRFRTAFYRWWLYSIYFHGQLPRPRLGQPEAMVQDVRVSQLRQHSTADLLDLLDLVQTMRDVVVSYIYPRLMPDHHEFEEPKCASRAASIVHDLGDMGPTGRIIRTYAKLGPEDLLHYYENIYSYPKKRLITDVHIRMPNFTMDQESINAAILSALEERNTGPVSVLTRLVNSDMIGGIVDLDDERDAQRDRREKDGVIAGRTGPFRQQHYGYAPRGDDGSYHEEYFRRHLEPERRSQFQDLPPLEVAMH